MLGARPSRQHSPFCRSTARDLGTENVDALPLCEKFSSCSSTRILGPLAAGGGAQLNGNIVGVGHGVYERKEQGWNSRSVGFLIALNPLLLILFDNIEAFLHECSHA